MKSGFKLEVMYEINHKWEDSYTAEQELGNIIVREDGLRVGRINDRYQVKSSNPDLTSKLEDLVHRHRDHF